jgi:sugar lactone lactonase YvrE
MGMSPFFGLFQQPVKQIQGGSMASKSSKKSNAKGGVRPKGSPVGKRKTSGSGQPGAAEIFFKYKWWFVGIVAVYLVIFLAINYTAFLKGKLKRDLPAETISRFSGVEKPCGAFSAEGIAAVGTDKFAVVDSHAKRVLLFSRDNTLIKTWGKEGKGPTDFQSISNIKSDDQGNLYIIDGGSADVRVYNTKGDIIQSVVLNSMGTYGPRTVTWDGKNFIVADTGSHRILKVSPMGELIEKWGSSQGHCKTCFNNPTSLASDHKGNYYVADFDNKRVVYLNASGQVVKIINLEGRPTDVAVNAQGYLFVSSAEGGFIRVYKPDAGDYVGSLKDQKGEDGFNSIKGMDFASDGTLLLAENEQVAQIKILSLEPIEAK